MIIVDTNVLSEALKTSRNPAVVNWLDAQIIETLYLAATSLAELRLGIEVLPSGKRKKALSDDVSTLVANFFGPRVLSFDREAALAYGRLIAGARAVGKAVSVADGQIGAIASVHNFRVATRDNGPFVALGIPVINPWEKLAK